MGYIYKITNNINSKVYIGQTIGTIEKRFNEHKRAAIKGCHYALHRAIKKYGIDNFSVEEIELLRNLYQEKEKILIALA